MAKKTFRRTVASILAVLAVTGNAIAPVGTGVLLAENAIVAEAANYTNGYCTYNSDTKTLTITGSLDNTDNGGNWLGSAEGTGLVLPSGVNKEEVQHVIIGKNASLPPQSGHMFEGFKNLETVEVQKGAKIRANAGQGSANLAGMFKGCEKLKKVDLSNLAGGEAVRYVDHMFEGCTALESVNITNISGDKLEDEDYNFYSRDPIAEAVKNCKNLTDVKMSTDFIDNAMKKLGFATPEAVLDDFLKGCPNADLLKAKLLEQYNSEEYYDAKYTWAADYTSCTASRQNKKTNKITEETVNCIVETTASSCTVAGKIVYTAVFTNSLFTTQTMQDNLPLKEHTPGDAEIENKVPASCTEPGSYDEVVYCEVCHAELSRDTKTIEKTPHKYEFVDFVWSEDYTSAQAKFSCSNDGCEESVLYDAEVTSKTTNPTCTEDGKIVYTAVYGENTDTKEETLSATGHSFTTFAGFEWSEDFTAQAKFTCSNDGCEESALYAADVTSEKQGNTTVYTATYTYTVDGAEKTETEQKTVEDEVVVHGKFDGNSIKFAENILLNFRAYIDDGYEEGAYVLFKYNHYEEEKTVRAEATKLADGGYMFRCPLTASELCIPVTAELYLADSEECVDTLTLSVKDICKKTIESENVGQGQKEAVKALLNYGGYVQVNQGLNLDNIAYDGGYQSPVDDVVVECDNEFEKPTETVGGVTYYAAALLLKDQITVKYAFIADSIEGVVFKINGKTVEAKKEGNYYVICADPVRMRTLDTVNEVKVETAEGTISFNHSVLNVASDVVKSEKTTEAYKNAMKAMYALREAVLKMKN